jgi:hypothetical protein
MKDQEFQKDCSKKCEELTKELLEAKAQLEKLKISSVCNDCGPGTTLITPMKSLVQSISRSQILILPTARRVLARLHSKD